MDTVKQAALDWISRALREESDLSPEEAATLAESLDAICSRSEIPVELLIKWIHFPAAGEKTAARWRGWCDKYVLTREALRPHLDIEPETRKLCPECAVNIAYRDGDRWWCSECGVIGISG